jgi:hypothetical protein
MKIKQTLFAALLFTGVSAFATEPLLFNDKGAEFLKSNPPLVFKKKANERTIGLGKSSSGSGKEWNEATVTGKNFFLNLGVFFPSKKYLNPYYTSGDPVYKVGFDFEIGSYWRFAKIEEGKMGIGLRVNWLTLSFSQMKYEKDIYRALQISPIRLGPQFSMAIDEYMGFDVFYQWGMNLTEEFGSIDSPGNKKKVGESTTFLGSSHEFGGIYHYKSYGIGLSYRMGGVRMISYTYDGKSTATDLLPDDTFMLNNFRIIINFRM